jgi:hypothetical protein
VGVFFWFCVGFFVVFLGRGGGGGWGKHGEVKLYNFPEIIRNLTADR